MVANFKSNLMSMTEMTKSVLLECLLFGRFSFHIETDDEYLSFIRVTITMGRVTIRNH